MYSLRENAMYLLSGDHAGLSWPGRFRLRRRRPRPAAVMLKMRPRALKATLLPSGDQSG
jgi:hypothetical protein